MLDRRTGYPSSDGISSPISGAGVEEFHDLSSVGGSTSNLEQLLVTSISNLTKTFQDEMSSFRTDMSNLRSDLNGQRASVDQGFLNLNDQMCIVESNLHVTISDLKSEIEINNEFRSVRNGIALNKSAIKSVENEISKK